MKNKLKIDLTISLQFESTAYATRLQLLSNVSVVRHNRVTVNRAIAQMNFGWSQFC